MSSRSILAGALLGALAPILAGALLGALALGLAAPAQAALGRAYSSVESDRETMGATLKSISGSGFTQHTLTLANRSLVTEYTRPDGTVFAVAWTGPGRPDLRTLLGDHFDVLQADNPRVGKRTRRPLSVNRSDFKVVTGGHSGAFWGVAVLPALEPASFSASARR